MVFNITLKWAMAAMGFLGTVHPAEVLQQRAKNRARSKELLEEALRDLRS